MSSKIIKAGDPVDIPAPLIVLYGDAGSRKTSFARTARNCLLLDFEGTGYRSHWTSDNVEVESWRDVEYFLNKGLFADYETVVFDTLRTMAESAYLVAQKNAGRNQFAAWSGMANLVKKAINEARRDDRNVVIVSHIADFETVDDDGEKHHRHGLDVDGNLLPRWLLQKADLVGRVSVTDNQADADFRLSAGTVSKGNVLWQIDNDDDQSLQKLIDARNETLSRKYNPQPIEPEETEEEDSLPLEDE